MDSIEFTSAEKLALRSSYRTLRELTSDVITAQDAKQLRMLVHAGAQENLFGRTRFGHHPVLHSLSVAIELCGSMGADRNMVLAVLLYNLGVDMDNDNHDIQTLIRGLRKVSSLYSKQATVKSDNFRKLLLTFAEDIRVIIIMIVDRLVLMKAINHHPAEDLVREVAFEASYLYAPLAHRLGLYKIKSELEDMSLKYTDRDMYSRIARKLNETKKSRDAYIESFIAPVKEALIKQGLKFDIKGRTKSIFSIWNKMKKQNTDLDHIYDLFAIRVILDV
ncbi:MAG: HD domain-containing protein, partial [Paramuribaculum sp.]|nr:HD domain-containing protein [Paramuribaculum sp.]